MKRKNNDKYHQQIANLAILGPILDPIAWNFSPVDRFLGNLVFGTSAEHFQGGFWTPKWSKRVAKAVNTESKRVSQLNKTTSPLTINPRNIFYCFKKPVQVQIRRPTGTSV